MKNNLIERLNNDAPDSNLIIEQLAPQVLEFGEANKHNTIEWLSALKEATQTVLTETFDSLYASMALGDLQAYITYIMQILSSLMMVSMVFVMLVMSRASFRRVNEILNERDGNEKTSNFYEDILEKWKKRIARFHLEKDWLSEYYVIIALYDWMKGQNELKKIDSGQLHQKLIKTRTSRLKNAVSWRYVEYKFRRNYLK